MNVKKELFDTLEPYCTYLTAFKSYRSDYSQVYILNAELSNKKVFAFADSYIIGDSESKLEMLLRFANELEKKLA